MSQLNSATSRDAAGDVHSGGWLLTQGRSEQPRAEEDFFPSPEQVEREIAHVWEKQPGPGLSPWVETYSKVGRRNSYLWQWVCRAVELTTLPCVAAELRDDLCETKVLGVMFDVLLDDLADQKGDGELLEELLSLPAGKSEPDLSRFSPHEQAYGRFAAQVWLEIARRAQQYPGYESYQDLLRYDYLQLCNVMRYSHLLNAHPELLNLTEHDLYTPHNMHIMICSTLDLMGSPHFDRLELGKLREVVWRAQCMGRIGNLITTWQRELGEGDFTSGVYARAVSRGDLTVTQLQTAAPCAIEAAIERGGHEAYFLDHWRRLRRSLLSRASQIRSLDVRQIAAGLERLICLHLGSRGYK